MLFPTTERVVFRNNPLEQVLTQIQFTPILSIAVERPASFQEKIRGSFPNYSRDPIPGLPEELAPLLARMTNAAVLTRDTFRSISGTSSIYLAQEFLAYEDRKYERWETFKGELTKVFTAFESVYAPVFVTRTGLRYVDVIQRSKLGLSPETPWSELISSELIGLLGHSSLRKSVTSSVGATTLRLDVPNSEVRIQHGTRPASATDSEESYFIDADFYCPTGRTISDAIGFLDQFNREAGNLFRWAIKPKLYDALQPSPVGAELQSLRAG